jgi:hypothetical protein
MLRELCKGTEYAVQIMSSRKIIRDFEIFTAVEFQVEVFWVVTLCSVVVGYQSF